MTFNNADNKHRNIGTISILGCGWFGTPLAIELIKSGYQIKGSTTSPQKLAQLKDLGIQPYLLQIAPVANLEQIDPSADFFNCDLLLVNIPPRRNTSEVHSFQQKIELISQLATRHQIPEIIFISSTSVYGDHNTEVDEHSAPIPDSSSGKILLEAEQYLKSQPSFRTTIIRFGGLVGPDRNPGRFLSGKTDVANGLAPINLIHLKDCIGITNQIFNQEAFGYLFNAVAPTHPTRQTFYTQAARTSKLPEPQFIPERQQWKIVQSANLEPLLHYAFRLPNWEEWI